MSDSEHEFEEYVHQHELLPKWGNVVANALNRQPGDSGLKTAARFAGLITSPVWVPAPTLAAHAYDEIMYSPISGFAGMPGRAQYKASQAIFGPKPAMLHPTEKFNLPPRPFKITTMAKAPRPVIAPRPIARPSSPARPMISNSSMMNNLHIMDPSWKLKINTTMFTPPKLSTTMKLVQPKLGASLPFRPFTSGVGFKAGNLSMTNRF